MLLTNGLANYANGYRCSLFGPATKTGAHRSQATTCAVAREPPSEHGPDTKLNRRARNRQQLLVGHLGFATRTATSARGVGYSGSTQSDRSDMLKPANEAGAKVWSSARASTTR